MAPDRKAELRLRLREARYPRRAAVRFTDGADDNPTVLKDCPDCFGRGRVDRLLPAPGVGFELAECGTCGGKGITGEIEPFFLNDEPEIAVMAGSDGWIQCPKCAVRFSVRDAHRWTGRRHVSCGQRIRMNGKV